MACVSSATRTVFETVTSLSSAVETSLTTFVVLDPEAVATTTVVVGTRTVLSLITGVAVTTTSSVLATVTETVLSSSPVSTLFEPCTSTTSTTSRTSTSSTTSTVPTTSAVTTTRGGSTTTSFTTVDPATSRTATSATSSSTSSNSNSSSTPVGAIAGGVIGGVAVILLGALAIWYFTTKGSRKDRDKDFDFAEDDAWDPAAGVASGAMLSSRMSRRRSGGGGGGSRRTGGGGGGMAMGGMQGGYGDEGYHDEVGRSNTFSRKKVAPADEQYAYYASAQPPPSTSSNSLSANAGIAGVGALGRQASHSSPSSREYDDPYGGLEGPGAGAGDGGYAVASRMVPSSSQGQLSRVAQLGGQSYSPPMPMPQPYNNNYAPQQPPFQRQGSGYDNALPPLPLPGTPASIPYHFPAPLSAPSSSRFDIPPATSPAPSHRSIPALGAWNEEGEEEGSRRGPLRVTNEEEEEEVERFGRGSGGAYDGLTDGLGRRD